VKGVVPDANDWLQKAQQEMSKGQGPSACAKASADKKAKVGGPLHDLARFGTTGHDRC